jgi:5-methylcytosine-specific restriction protein A
LTIREVLERVASEFPIASAQNFAGHDLANFMRGQGADAIKDAIARDDLIVKGSPGQANWADVPWFGLFQPEITETATKGYYVVYLFNVAMTEVSLSLGQGVTALRTEFGRFAKQEMLRRATLVRDRVPEH